MKVIIIIGLILTGFLLPETSVSQEDYTSSTTFDSSKIYVVIKNDGTEFIGNIIENNEREILLKTINRGNIYIPQHEIKEIRKIDKPGDIRNGEYIGEELFSTRYFLTTNGMSIKKGESYALINMYGPEVHYSVNDKLSLGIMTSWGAVPVIGAAKYSISSKDNFHFGLGMLAGTGSWAAIDIGGMLPFASVTFGNRNKNINLASGYGFIYNGASVEGAALFSFSSLAKIGKSTSFIFDSFIVIEDNLPYALIIPGLRFQKRIDRAFQFGFAGILYSYRDYYNPNIVFTETVPLPIPFVSWFLKF